MCDGGHTLDEQILGEQGDKVKLLFRRMRCPHCQIFVVLYHTVWSPAALLCSAATMRVFCGHYWCQYERMFGRVSLRNGVAAVTTCRSIVVKG